MTYLQIAVFEVHCDGPSCIERWIDPDLEAVAFHDPAQVAADERVIAFPHSGNDPDEAGDTQWLWSGSFHLCPSCRQAAVYAIAERVEQAFDEIELEASHAKLFDQTGGAT